MKRLCPLLLLLLFSASLASAQTIEVVTEEWPPYNYSLDGRVEGVVTDVVRAVLERAGLDYSIRVLPWARSYKTALMRENVMIYSILRLPDREGDFQWISVPGLAVRMYLFKPRYRRDIQAKSLDDVRSRVIGVTRDTSTHHFLRSKGFVDGRNLLPLPNEEQNLRMTSPGVERTDLATGDKLSMALWLHAAGMPPDYLEELLPLFEEDIYLAFGMKSPKAVVDRVRRAVASMHEDGSLRALLDRHYNADKAWGTPSPESAGGADAGRLSGGGR